MTSSPPRQPHGADHDTVDEPPLRDRGGFGMAPCQCRAARAVLGWSAADLATTARVSRSTISDFEREARHPIRSSLDALQRVFLEAGVVMVRDETHLGVAWTEDGKTVSVMLRIAA
jgi:predicted transcriptional regulator